MSEALVIVESPAKAKTIKKYLGSGYIVKAFENQLDAVEARLTDRPTFLFVNVSALHQPNHFYLDNGPAKDTLASHAAALRYVDAHVPRLVSLLRRPTLLILCSDHGTLYGEDGYVGHRVGHPIVTTVPYAEVML